MMRISRLVELLGWRKWWREWGMAVGILTLVCGLGLGLRLPSLTSAFPAFADEAIYLRWAQVMKHEPTLRFLPLSDGKQPLFMWITMFWMRDYGDPLLWGRLVSVGAGVLGMVGVFFLSWELFRDRRVGFLASLFYAIVPFLVFFDRMGLVDSLLAALGVWFFYLAAVTVRTLDLGAALLAGGMLGAAWLTKSPAVFFVGLLPTSLLLVKWPRGWEERLARLVKLGGLWVVIWVVAGVMYNFLRLGPNFHLLNSRNWDYVFPLSHLWENPKDPFIFHVPEIAGWNFRLLTPLIFGLVLAGMVWGIIKKERRVWWLLLLAGVPLGVQAMYAKVFTTRYILFTVPYLLAVGAWGGIQLKSKIAKQKSKIVGGLLLLVVVLPAIWFDWKLIVRPEEAELTRDMRSGYLEEWTAGTGIKEVADFIKGRVGGTDRGIVVGTEGFFGTLPDGLQLYLDGVSRVTVVGIGLNIGEVREQLVAAKRAGNEVYLVANDTRLVGEPEKMGIKLLESYPKAVRPDGTRESLLLFEVTEKVLDD